MINAKELGTAIRKIYSQLDVSQRLYVHVFVLLVAYVVSAMLPWQDLKTALLFLGFGFWILAICNDLLALYKTLYESVLGKALLLIVFSMCANFTIALSGQGVNNIVGVDPSKFPHTIALLSVLAIPVLIFAALSILGVFILVAIPFFMMVHTIPDEKAKTIFFAGLLPKETILYPRTTRLIQLISFAVFCWVAIDTSKKNMDHYEAFLTDTAKSFLYEFEMYSKAPCELSKGSRVAYLGEGYVLVGSKVGSVITFSVKECKFNSPHHIAVEPAGAGNVVH